MLLIIKLGGRAPSGREVCCLFFLLFFFGSWYRRAPRSASSPHALLDGTIKIIGPWPSRRTGHSTWREGVEGLRGRCLGTPNGKAGDGMAPSGLFFPGFLCFHLGCDRTSHQARSRVSMAAALVVLVGRQCRGEA